MEWELQLISKDSETRKLIFDILNQRNEIEAIARQNERPEEYLKDLKDLTQNSSIASHFESEKEKERQRKKAEKIKKRERQYKEEERKWEKHEEEMEKERQKELYEQEDLDRRKRRLMEKDLNYDSEEEKKKIKQNPKKYEEKKLIRQKEKEFDDLMRKKEKQQYHKLTDTKMNEDVTDLVLTNTGIAKKYNEPEAKTTVIYKEYDEEETDTIENNLPKLENTINLNIDNKKLVKKITLEEDIDNNDPYNKKDIVTKIELHKEFEKEFAEWSTKESEEDRKAIEENEKNQIFSSTTPIINKDKVHITIKTGDGMSKEKIIEIHKQIYEVIPKKQEELFKFPINWSTVYKYDILESKIRPWFIKKFKELLGVEEQALTNIIIKKLSNKASPYDISEKLKVIFEEETLVILFIYLFIYFL